MNPRNLSVDDEEQHFIKQRNLTVYDEKTRRWKEDMIMSSEYEVHVPQLSIPSQADSTTNHPSTPSSWITRRDGQARAPSGWGYLAGTSNAPESDTPASLSGFTPLVHSNINTSASFPADDRIEWDEQPGFREDSQKGVLEQPQPVLVEGEWDASSDPCDDTLGYQDASSGLWGGTLGYRETSGPWSAVSLRRDFIPIPPVNSRLDRPLQSGNPSNAESFLAPDIVWNGYGDYFMSDPATEYFTSPKTYYTGRDEEYEKQLALLKQSTLLSKFWTGTNEQFDVDYETLSLNIKSQLNTRHMLGTGKNGEVHKVLCGGIYMARKGVRASTQRPLSAIRSEVEAVRKLEEHRHIVKLIGSYLTTYHGEETLHILTFPVADCDLNLFLDSLEALNGKAAIRHRATPDLSVGELLTAARCYSSQKVEDDILSLGTFLKKTMGCMAEAVKWVHSKMISHDDLKPANILLHRGLLLITDFGISRDRHHAAGTSTEFFPGSTSGYCAPEKQDRHNPFKSDVYSLGCIYMHMFSVLTARMTRKECTETLCSHRDREKLIQEHLSVLFPTLLLDNQILSTSVYRKRADAGVAKLIEKMLLNDRHRRPDIKQVCHLLSRAGSEVELFYGQCCLPAWEEGTSPIDSVIPVTSSRWQERDPVSTFLPASSAADTQPQPLQSSISQTFAGSKAPFYCRFEGCKRAQGSKKGFARKDNRNVHEKHAHGPEGAIKSNFTLF